MASVDFTAGPRTTEDERYRRGRMVEGTLQLIAGHLSQVLVSPF
jgi:hypothetical protein